MRKFWIMKTLPYILGMTLIVTVCASSLVPMRYHALDTNKMLSSSNQQVIMSGTRNIILTARDKNHGTDEVCDSINGKIDDANNVAEKISQSTKSEHYSWSDFAEDVAEHSKMVAEIADDLGKCPMFISGARAKDSVGAAIIGSVLVSLVFSHL